MSVGPTIERECGFCDGGYDLPESTCPGCDGRGMIVVHVHPFVTLETIHEHLEGIRIAMGVIHHSELEARPGAPLYHWRACEEAVSSLFQQLVVMLPEEHERTEGGGT